MSTVRSMSALSSIISTTASARRIGTTATMNTRARQVVPIWCPPAVRQGGGVVRQELPGRPTGVPLLDLTFDSTIWDSALDSSVLGSTRPVDAGQTR